jgi:hypothetical protein
MKFLTSNELSIISGGKPSIRLLADGSVFIRVEAGDTIEFNAGHFGKEAFLGEFSSENGFKELSAGVYRVTEYKKDVPGFPGRISWMLNPI